MAASSGGSTRSAVERLEEKLAQVAAGSRASILRRELREVESQTRALKSEECDNPQQNQKPKQQQQQQSQQHQRQQQRLLPLLVSAISPTFADEQDQKTQKLLLATLGQVLSRERVAASLLDEAVERLLRKLCRAAGRLAEQEPVRSCFLWLLQVLVKELSRYLTAHPEAVLQLIEAFQLVLRASLARLLPSSILPSSSSSQSQSQQKALPVFQPSVIGRPLSLGGRLNGALFLITCLSDLFNLHSDLMAKHALSWAPLVYLQLHIPLQHYRSSAPIIPSTTSSSPSSSPSSMLALNGSMSISTEFLNDGVKQVYTAGRALLLTLHRCPGVERQQLASQFEADLLNPALPLLPLLQYMSAADLELLEQDKEATSFVFDFWELCVRQLGATLLTRPRPPEAKPLVNEHLLPICTSIIQGKMYPSLVVRFITAWRVLPKVLLADGQPIKPRFLKLSMGPVKSIFASSQGCPAAVFEATLATWRSSVRIVLEDSADSADRFSFLWQLAIDPVVATVPYLSAEARLQLLKDLRYLYLFYDRFDPFWRGGVDFCALVVTFLKHQLKDDNLLVELVNLWRSYARKLAASLAQPPADKSRLALLHHAARMLFSAPGTRISSPLLWPRFLAATEELIPSIPSISALTNTLSSFLHLLDAALCLPSPALPITALDTSLVPWIDRAFTSQPSLFFREFATPLLTASFSCPLLHPHIWVALSRPLVASIASSEAPASAAAGRSPAEVFDFLVEPLTWTLDLQQASAASPSVQFSCPAFYADWAALFAPLLARHPSDLRLRMLKHIQESDSPNLLHFLQQIFTLDLSRDHLTALRGAYFSAYLSRGAKRVAFDSVLLLLLLQKHVSLAQPSQIHGWLLSSHLLVHFAHLSTLPPPDPATTAAWRTSLCSLWETLLARLLLPPPNLEPVRSVLKVGLCASFSDLRHLTLAWWHRTAPSLDKVFRGRLISSLARVDRKFSTLLKSKSPPQVDLPSAERSSTVPSASTAPAKPATASASSPPRRQDTPELTWFEMTPLILPRAQLKLLLAKPGATQRLRGFFLPMAGQTGPLSLMRLVDHKSNLMLEQPSGKLTPLPPLSFVAESLPTAKDTILFLQAMPPSERPTGQDLRNRLQDLQLLNDNTKCSSTPSPPPSPPPSQSQRTLSPSPSPPASPPALQHQRIPESQRTPSPPPSPPNQEVLTPSQLKKRTNRPRDFVSYSSLDASLASQPLDTRPVKRQRNPSLSDSDGGDAVELMTAVSQSRTEQVQARAGVSGVSVSDMNGLITSESMRRHLQRLPEVIKSCDAREKMELQLLLIQGLQDLAKSLTIE